MLGDFATHVDACDPQLLARSVVALHQHSDGVATGFGVEHPRASSDSPLEFVTDHAGSTANIAFFHRSGMCGVEGVPGIFRLHVESVDVVQISVPSFGNYGQGPP